MTDLPITPMEQLEELLAALIALRAPAPIMIDPPAEIAKLAARSTAMRPDRIAFLQATLREGLTRYGNLLSGVDRARIVEALAP